MDSDKASILVVEDESIVAMDIQARLRNLGYKIAGRAVTGKDAVALALSKRPSCILMDIQLQDEINGIEAADRIHQEYSVPIIFLTAFADDNTIKKARESNPYGYILKPFQERELAVTIQMAIYKHGMERALLEKERFLSASLSSVGDAVIVTGSREEIRYCNPSARILLNEIQESNELPLERADLRHIIPRLFDPSLGQDDRKILSFPWEGENRDYEIQTTLIKEDQEDQRKQGSVYVFRDISKRLEYEKTLQEAKEKAREVNQTKDRLLANISHELRTPLNSIIGMTDLTLEEDLTPLVREYMDIVRSSADSLLQVINRILEYSQVERGSLSLDYQILDMASLLDEIITPYQGLAEKKNLFFRKTISEQLPDNLWGDREKIILLSRQLVDNAVKFSDKGTIDIQFSLGDWNPQYRTGEIPFEISISDQGQGIHDDLKKKIYESFTQGDSSSTRTEGGLGLGLTLVRELADLMEGSVFVKDNSQGGSTFTVCLALNMPPSLTRESSREDSREKSENPSSRQKGASKKGESKNQESRAETLPEKKSIAIIEDDPTNRFVLRKMLENLGTKVIEFHDGNDFHQSISTQGEDIQGFFLDLQMPDIDGYTILDQIRSSQVPGVPQNSPVVVLTAHASEEDKARCLAQGADLYMTKPIITNELSKAHDLIMKGGRGKEKTLKDMLDHIKLLCRDSKWEEAEREIVSCRRQFSHQIENQESKNLLQLVMALRAGQVDRVGSLLDKVENKKGGTP